MTQKKRQQTQVKPYQVFLFCLVVVAVTGVSLFLINANTLSLSTNITLKFPNIKTLVSDNKPAYADISHIIGPLMDSTNDDSILGSLKVVKPLVVPYNLVKADQLRHSILDTLERKQNGKAAKARTNVIIHDKQTVPDQKPESYGVDTVKADALALSKLSYEVEFPVGNNSILNPFFEALFQLNDNTDLIRVLHYGDSQIEGDRITSFFRYKLQKRFGGTGVGLLCVNPVVGSPFVYVFNSGNWMKYLPGDSTAPDNNFGAMLSKSFCIADTVSWPGNDSLLYHSWVETVMKRSYSYKSGGIEKIDLKLLYDSSCKSFDITIKDKETDTVMVMENLKAETDVNLKKWPLPTVGSFLMEFSSIDSPGVYALMVDGAHGVAVDNIPIRGSAGLEFRRCNRNNLANTYLLLNAKLIILQFGVNVVPNIRDDYTYYEEWFFSNLNYIKEAAPGIPVLVIGVSDMSRKSPDGIYYESFPNIELIRNAQRKAAFRSGCAFWDLYSAMGGNNSMPSWVFAEPPLANKDFTHFTAKGAKLISQMLYNAVISEYEKFLKHKNSVR